MARGSPYQTAFSAGELSPRILGRVDLEKYGFGLAACENFLALREGPVTRRSGTRFVGEVIDSTKRSRLIPFVFSDEQAYVLEFGDRKIRIFANEGRIVPPSRTFSTISNNDIIPITDYTYSNRQGPFQFLTTGTLPTGLSTGTNYYIIRLTADTFSVSTTPSGAAVSITAGTGSGTHTIEPRTGVISIEIDTTYLESELLTLDYAQTADVFYIVHPAHKPAKLLRVSATQWRLSDVVFFDGPYLDENITATQVQASAGTGSINIGATADLFVAGRDEGRLFRIGDGTNWGWARIDTVTSATVAAATVIGGPGVPVSLTGKWRFGLLYPGNYPHAVTFHEQRLLIAGTPLLPQRFDGSVIGDYENFAPTGGPLRSSTTFDSKVNDNNAYSFTIVSERVNVISWMTSARSLLIGTVNGIWPAQASSALESISPNSINVRRSNARGASGAHPVSVDDATAYLAGSTRRMYAVVYSQDSDSFVPIDLTMLADHVIDTGAFDLEFAGDPDSIIWVLRNDGVLCAVTVDISQNVTAWSRHPLGGNGFAESMAVIPAPVSATPSSPGAHPNQDHDQLWLMVRRTINGQTRRYIEFIEDRFPIDADVEDAYFVDCGLSYSGGPISSVAGLDHLEGQEVSILADGAVLLPQTVVGGQIALSEQASRVHVGFSYTSKITTLPLERAGSQSGPSQGKRKRVDHLEIRFDRTVGGEIARDERESNWDPILFRSMSDLLGTAIPLFSNDKVLPVNPGWSLQARHSIRQTLPLPMTILSLGFRAESTERGVA